MPDDNEWKGYLSASQLAEEIGVTEHRVNRAILILNLYNTGVVPKFDARRRLYPPGTKEAVEKWLQQN